MSNPLSTTAPNAQLTDLLGLAQQGDPTALSQLVKEHEPFIYNVAWKYTNDQEEARDLTQEVLIKVVTKLPSFKGNSSFQTWVYRIVVNEFLQSKRRPMEDRWEDFQDFAAELNAIPSPDLTAEEEEEKIFRTKTARNRCMSGMLMCLTREQRLIYILGDVFGIDHNIGAEVFSISKANYRKRLSRTRKEFHAFMNQQCGLVKKENPCRCAKKAKAMEAAGRMQTDERLFDPAYYATISQFAEKHADEAADIVDRKYIEFFQNHPSKADFSTDTVVQEIINDPELHKFFD